MEGVLRVMVGFEEIPTKRERQRGVSVGRKKEEKGRREKKRRYRCSSETRVESAPNEEEIVLNSTCFNVQSFKSSIPSGA